MNTRKFSAVEVEAAAIALIYLFCEQSGSNWTEIENAFLTSDEQGIQDNATKALN